MEIYLVKGNFESVFILRTLMAYNKILKCILYFIALYYPIFCIILRDFLEKI